ncbi:hypothetical protein [Campylobacter fetus]|uniref:hypothetical protein n=1 Tax=Campylobacter fetus TaxID=196 RepID=UPI0003E3DAD1|nr:hypothetical protein [Campylobacter fetus]OCS25245.1 hypothetical protein CFVB10_09465 [Campylobacter fetus subsp. venerealis cfvB10]AIR80359.1 hypothetical protein CFV97608_0724 [Campylobacter fetus subsp. venerealis 97/608]AIR80959.1 hypothetical protein CFV97608_1342 [Campylobacter fetus subsp. venerealis 97/608]EAJ5705216.1 hypothetical protein [Campylobacter fetus]OCS25960.1 hypothetical protein CFV33872_09575 [Campylobacter fetus subsp. venerealis CCUG 33872]
MKTIFVANHKPPVELGDVIIPKNILLWGQIPKENVIKHLEPLTAELEKLCETNEEINLVIAGEPRATCFLVKRFENKENITCCTTFSVRKSVDETMPDGTVKKTAIFEFAGLVPFV